MIKLSFPFSLPTRFYFLPFPPLRRCFLPSPPLQRGPSPPPIRPSPSLPPSPAFPSSAPPPFRLLPLPKHTPHSPAPVLFRRLPSVSISSPLFDTSPAPPLPAPASRSIKQSRTEGLCSVLFDRTNAILFGLIGQTEWRASVRPNRTEGRAPNGRLPPFGPVWPNGAEKREGAGGWKGPVPKSEEETGPRGHRKKASAGEGGVLRKGKKTGDGNVERRERRWGGKAPCREGKRRRCREEATDQRRKDSLKFFLKKNKKRPTEQKLPSQ